MRLPLLLSLAATSTLLAQQLPDPEFLAASKRGVSFLVKEQDQRWGVFSHKKNDPRGERYHVQRESTATTGLAVMAILANGHLPGEDTPEGRAVDKAIDLFLNDEVYDEKDGYFGQRDGSRMYGHGIISLALAELIGLTPDAEKDKRLRERTEAAIRLIIESQKVQKDGRHRGGWRYNPHDRDSDLSASVWQVMALRAAKGAGIEVPEEAIASAVSYVKSCSSAPENAGPDWTPKAHGFGYQGHGDGRASTTAAGVLSLQVCGAYDAPEVKAGAIALLEKPPEWGQSWFYYGLYYYSQGMFQMGDEYEEASLELLREVVLPNQKDDGSWPAIANEAAHGPIYSTSMALLALSVRHHYLPIYQR